MLGNVPFAAGFGNGIYVPAAFLLATIVLTIFSVGYAAMARKVSAVGGFYSFISQGLGREAGMSAGLASLASYSVFEASLYGPLRLLRQRLGQDPLRRQRSLALVRAVRHRALRRPQLSRRAVVGRHPRRRPRPRSHHPVDLRLSASSRRRPAPTSSSKSLNLLAGADAGDGAESRRRRYCRRCRRSRHLHGLLVVGRLRDGSELCRGIEGPQAHHPAVALLLGDRPGPLLHLHELVRGLGLPDRRRHAGQGDEGLEQLLPGAASAVRRPLGVGS